MSNPRVSSSKSGTVSGGPSGYTLPKKDETRSFRDFVLYAPAEGTKDWRHHLLKLVPASRSDQVDLRQFEQPVKLNRRDERYIRSLGQDAETNEEEDQRTASNPDRDESLIAPGASRTGNSESAAAKRRKPFEKKTTRVFQTDASMASRKLAREEQFPWLLEDATAKQRWVGHLAGGSSGLGGVHDGATGGTSATKAGAHVLFVVDEGQKGMHVLPADRTYRFHPKHTSRNVDADEAELEFEKRSKSKVDDRWGYRNKRTLQPGQNKTDPDNAPTPSFSAVHGARSGAAGRKGRVKREDNEDAFDEVEFEEEMQDDEEGTGTFGDEAIEEEDAKLLEERIKRSQRGGNHLSGGIDTTQAEDDSAVFNAKQEILDKAGRRAQKLLRKHKANDEEDDDDSSEEDTKVKNPYALQEESDQEDDEQITSSAAGIDGQTSQQANSKKPKPTASSVTGAKVQASSGSRSGSPAPRSATASHPGSPVATSVGTKRKADDEGGPSGKPHKREKSAAAPQTPADADAVKQVLTEQTVIRFVREAASPSEATAKNLLRFVKHKLGVNPRGPGVSDLLQTLIRATCTLEDGILVLKPGVAL